MAWTTPVTWADGALVAAVDLNAQVRDNLRYLKGLDGVPRIESAIELPEASTPSTPSSGYGRLYFDTGGLLTSLNDAGEVRALARRAAAATANQLAYWSSASEVAGDAGLTYNATTDVLTVGGGLVLPRASGSAVFAIDGTSGGSSLVIANGATATPFGGTNNFAGLLLVKEIAVDGSAALFLTSGGVIVEIADPSGHYSITSGTGSSTNVYLSSLIVTIQNNRGGSRTYNVIPIRIGASN